MWADPKVHVENALLERVRDAEHAYRNVAGSAKEKINCSRDIGWNQPDGAYAFESAVNGERLALERYHRALIAFSDFLLYRKAPRPEDLLGPILNRAIEDNGASMGTLQVLDRSRKTLSIKAQRGFERPFLDFFKRVERGEASACGTAFAAMQRVIVKDVSTSEIFAGTESLGVLTDAGVRAVQSVPMVSSEKGLVGVLSVHYRKPIRRRTQGLGNIDQFASEAATLIVGAGLA